MIASNATAIPPQVSTMPTVRFRLALVAILLSAGPVVAQPTPPSGKPRVDRLGDPLPAGALFRIGTTRLQLDREIQNVVVSADGTRVFALSDDALGVWEVPSGREILRKRIRSSERRPLALRPDGGAVAFNDGDYPAVFDAVSGQIIAEVGHVVQACAFSPDGKTLVVVRWGNTFNEFMVEHWDVAAAKPVKEWRSPREPLLSRDSLPYWEFAVSAGGKFVATLETTPAATKQKATQLVRIHDPVARAEVCRWQIEAPGVRHVVFSPDCKRVAAASFDAPTSAEATLFVWDIATGKELARCKVQGRLRTGRFALAFAPDGASLFVTDAAGVAQWDPVTAKRLREYPGVGGPIAFAGDKTLIAQGPLGALRCIDVASGKDLLPLPRAGAQAALAPDGRRIAWSEGEAIVLAETTSGKQVQRWTAHESFVTWLAFAPDGRMLASAGPDMHIRLWELPAGREVRTMVRDGVNQLAFSRDGMRLLSGGVRDACLWDVASGKRLGWWYGAVVPVVAGSLEAIASPDGKARNFRLIEPATGKTLQTLEGYREKVAYSVQNPDETVDRFEPFSPRISPDGRLLMAGCDVQNENDHQAVGLWEVASGKRLPLVLRGDTLILDKPAFSPDGSLLALMRSDRRMCLLSTVNGATVRMLGEGKFEMAASPVFTPDGRIVVTAVGGVVQCWEVASGGEIARLEGQPGQVHELLLAADGRALATASTDHTILVWDFAHLATTDPPAAIAPDELWSDLASLDARRGRRAIETLAGIAQAVAMLRQRLKPAVAADAKKLAVWIADLGGNDFAQRQRAEEELQRSEELAAEALRKALADKPALEARRRIENLLKKLEPTAMLSAEALRGVRAVQALESLDTPESRRFLEQLARGVPEARLTVEATAALGRLTK
jgi:WD40 repeat protein